MASVTVNLQDIQRTQEVLAQKAFIEANKTLQKKFRANITEDVWDWDGETLRKNGSIAGSPRDIVDTGELDTSYKASVSGTTYTHEWTAQHALIVLLGASLRGGGMIPARNWIAKTLKESPFIGIFEKEFAKL